MTSAADTRADYREMIDEDGEIIILRRIVAGGPPIEAEVRARVTGYQPTELVGGIKQGDSRLIVLAEDVEAKGFPVPLSTGGSDKVIVGGKTQNIEAVDDRTRRVGGVLIAYDITARG